MYNNSHCDDLFYGKACLGRICSKLLKCHWRAKLPGNEQMVRMFIGIDCVMIDVLQFPVTWMRAVFFMMSSLIKFIHRLTTHVIIVEWKINMRPRSPCNSSLPRKPQEVMINWILLIYGWKKYTSLLRISPGKKISLIFNLCVCVGGGGDYDLAASIFAREINFTSHMLTNFDRNTHKIILGWHL